MFLAARAQEPLLHRVLELTQRATTNHLPIMIPHATTRLQLTLVALGVIIQSKS